MKASDTKQIEEEIGDLLLSVTSLCRKLSVDPEVALNRATDKFIERFSLIEETVLREGKSMEELSMTELDRIWNEIKYKKLRKN